MKQHIKITLHTSKQSHNWLDFHHKSLWEPIRKGHELFMRQRKFQLALAQTTIGCFSSHEYFLGKVIDLYSNLEFFKFQAFFFTFLQPIN